MYKSGADHVSFQPHPRYRKQIRISTSGQNRQARCCIRIYTVSHSRQTTRTGTARRLVVASSTSAPFIQPSCPSAVAHPASRRRPQRSRKSPILSQTIQDTHTTKPCMILTASLRRHSPLPRLPATKLPVLLRHHPATFLRIYTPIREPARPATPTPS